MFDWVQESQILFTFLQIIFPLNFYFALYLCFAVFCLIQRLKIIIVKNERNA